jgi:hypothetical protein
VNYPNPNFFLLCDPDNTSGAEFSLCRLPSAVAVNTSAGDRPHKGEIWRLALNRFAGEF